MHQIIVCSFIKDFIRLLKDLNYLVQRGVDQDFYVLVRVTWLVVGSEAILDLHVFLIESACDKDTS
jgi:hypothetical protein